MCSSDLAINPENLSCEPQSQRRDDLEGMEEKIGVEAIEFDHDACRDGEPDCGEHWSGGEELFHGEPLEVGSASWQAGDQRGETVILLSDSVSLPLANSLKAAIGQLAAAMVLFSARGTSIWISCMVASLREATACR